MPPAASRQAVEASRARQEEAIAKARKYAADQEAANKAIASLTKSQIATSKDALRAQMGAMQAVGLKNNVDIYKNSSPVAADRHIDNIAASLAKDYGVTDLRDIRVEPGIIPKMAGQAELKNGQLVYKAGTAAANIWGAGSPLQSFHVANKYFNSKNGKEIPAAKFASTGEGDGFSYYSLSTIRLADGKNVVVPIQEYSKSGFGAVQESLAPVLPIVALALAATGVGTAIGTSILGAGASVGAATAVGSAALNLGAQALAGKIENVSDVLQAVAPAAVTYGLSEVAGVYKAVDTAKQALAYDALVSADKLEDLGTVSSSIKAATDAGVVVEKLTGISGKTADVLGNAIEGGVGAALSDENVAVGTVFGALEGFKTATPEKLREPATVTETNPFKSSFEITTTTLTSAPENTDALSKALGIDTTGLDMGDVIPTDNLLTAQTSTVTNPISGITTINKQTEEALAGAGTTTVSSINDQTDELFEPFSKEGFMPGKTTTAPMFKSTTQEGMLGDVGSGVSNLTGSTIIGDVTDVNKTNTYGGMLGEVGSGASNLTGSTKIGDVTSIDTTGVNKELGGTLGTSQLNETKSNILDTTASTKPTISGENIVKMGVAVAGVAAAGSALDSATNKTTTVPTVAKPTYANAPIKGFRMQKMQNEGGLTTYIPYINQTSLLPVPTGYKAI